MNKSVFLLGVMSVAVLAADLRPPVPDVGYAEERRKVLNQCKVPSHVVVLPPMVESDYRECANLYYRPESGEAAYRLSLMLNEEVEIERIEAAEGFLRAYEIDARVANRSLRLLCDEKVNRCYAIGKVYQQPEKKDKK